MAVHHSTVSLNHETSPPESSQQPFILGVLIPYMRTKEFKLHFNIIFPSMSTSPKLYGPGWGLIMEFETFI
jgi:hypothetical protein